MRFVVLGLVVGILAVFAGARQATAGSYLGPTLPRLASRGAAPTHSSSIPVHPRRSVPRSPVRQARPLARTRHSLRGSFASHALLPGRTELGSPFQTACRVLLSTLVGASRWGGLMFSERGPPAAKRTVPGPNAVRATVSNNAPLLHRPSVLPESSVPFTDLRRCMLPPRARARPPPHACGA